MKRTRLLVAVLTILCSIIVITGTTMSITAVALKAPATQTDLPATQTDLPATPTDINPQPQSPTVPQQPAPQPQPVVTQPEPEIPAAISFNTTKLTIKGVKTKTITATLANPQDSIASVKSSKTNVAKAKIRGNNIVITPTKKTGDTTITVTTAKGATAKIKVTVKAKVALNENKITLKKGKTFKIKVLAIPATVKAKSFKSGNPNVATVDAKTGKVKAIKKGDTIITVTLNNGEALKLKVKVKK